MSALRHWHGEQEAYQINTESRHLWAAGIAAVLPTEEVFAAAGLADIAAEAGLTAGALVQRFGSKRDLLLAVSARAAETTPVMFDDLRWYTPSALGALRAYADCMSAMGESPSALAHHLAYLQLDLTDPDFHRHTMAQARAIRAALRDLVAKAVAARELIPDVDPDSLARTVEVTVGGSLMTWAFYRDGTVGGLGPTGPRCGAETVSLSATRFSLPHH
jgi:AcrR family transcriptional regulator